MGVLFYGTDDLISVADSASLGIESDEPFSISLWMKTTNTGVQDLVNKEDESDSYTGYEVLLVSQKIRCDIIVNNASSVVIRVAGSTDVVDGTWYHIVETYDGSRNASGVNLYVNAVEEGSIQTDALTTDTIVTNEPLRIGAKKNNGVPFDGSLTEIAMWSVELTQAEVSQLYNSRIKGMPLQIQSSSLIAYWPMDDGADGTSADGQTFKDLSGTGNDGTGDDGANNSGLTNKGEEVLSYPCGGFSFMSEEGVIANIIRDIIRCGGIIPFPR
jgi:hypothetical protein